MVQDSDLSKPMSDIFDTSNILIFLTTMASGGFALQAKARAPKASQATYLRLSRKLRVRGLIALTGLTRMGSRCQLQRFQEANDLSESL